MITSYVVRGMGGVGNRRDDVAVVEHNIRILRDILVKVGKYRCFCSDSCGTTAIVIILVRVIGVIAIDP